MKHESARRRGQIADAVRGLRGLGISALILDAGRGPEPAHVRRERALRQVVGCAARKSAAHLVLDLDRILVGRDARTLAIACREFGASSLTYSHQSLTTQPLLALPDVIAWCWARSREWRRRIAPIIIEHIKA